MSQIIGGWWPHHQTAKAPARPSVFGGFPIRGDGGVDGFCIYIYKFTFTRELHFGAVFKSEEFLGALPRGPEESLKT